MTGRLALGTRGIPEGSILGLNYSGMHDSAIAMVAPDGKPIYAVSLERISRVKQDGRPPFSLLEDLPWARFSCVAVSAPGQFHAPGDNASTLLTVALPAARTSALTHEPAFQDFLGSIPCEKVFVGHQDSHVASAFWLSGFSEAMCLTYDGGMCNDPWFGGLCQCNSNGKFDWLDRFSAQHYAKVTSLYTFVTALLGFTPNKHEGKITGLAAFARPTDRCHALLKKWFELDYFEIESALRWVFSYSHISPPQLFASPALMRRFRDEAADIPREELAATVQDFAERHILDILAQAKKNGWHNPNICLAGGLFANVKINQRVVESGFEHLFVAPPMTDDGTALGAALHVASTKSSLRPRIPCSMFLGPRYSAEETLIIANKHPLVYQNPPDIAKVIAEHLARGAVVAVFQGAAEFGPRALGNRSVLAQADHSEINQNLNDRLNRTEFMPFAPMTRAEDAILCYRDIDRVSSSAAFMTVTVNCTESMRIESPAVVHVDGTARPQLVTRESNPLIHAVLGHYKDITGKLAIVNTSFNIHEEPIVCSPEDALRGFFESGLDFLYLEGVGLIPFDGNEKTAVTFLHSRLKQRSFSGHLEKTLIGQLDGELKAQRDISEQKEVIIRNLVDALQLERMKPASPEPTSAEIGILSPQLQSPEDSYAQNIHEVMREIRGKLDALIHSTPEGVASPDLVRMLEAKELVINEQKRALDSYRRALPQYKLALAAFRASHAVLLWPLGFFARHARVALRPRLGNLNQHPPKELTLPRPFASALPADKLPSIVIVTPSFRQGTFIERTLRSVLDQNYPKLEYYVQDGGSNDGTAEILQTYADRIAGWKSAPDGGQSHAINLGLAQTTGEIMAWLNSDDLLLPGALAYVGDYFARHPEVDVVYGHRILIDEEDQEIGRWVLPAHEDEALSWVDFVPQETLFWRRSLWGKAGESIDESFKFAMDWEMLLRFREAGARMVRLPRFLGAFRIHEAQKTSAVINEIGAREMDRLRQRSLGRTVTHREIRRALWPYMAKHVLSDLAYRVRRRLHLA